MVQGGYAAFLRRWLWLLTLGIIIGIGAGLLFRAAQPLNTLEMRWWPPQLYHAPEFHSRVTLQMLPTGELLGKGLVSQEDLDNLALSLASEVKTSSVLEGVSAELTDDFSPSADELAAMIEATPLAGSIGVEITVTSPDPAQSGLIANKLVDHVSQQIAKDQETKLKSQLSQLSRSLEALQIEIAAADKERQQNLAGNVSAMVDIEIEALREMYSDVYREYMALSLGMSGATVDDNVNRTQRMNELTQNLEDLQTRIDKAEAARNQASGGVVTTVTDVEAAVLQQLYNDVYWQYVNLNIQLPIATNQLFMPAELTPVHEVSPDRIRSRDVVVLGGLGGLVLAWSTAGVIDYIRVRRHREEDIEA